MPLAELQQQVRDALVASDGGDVGVRLLGGPHPERRFAIHRRHFEASLIAAIAGRFPATGWLIGGQRFDAAARAFVHAHPPAAPCIAEYGDAFPGFLATWSGTAHLRYAPDFATLDWHLGRVSVTVERPALTRDELVGVDPDALPDLAVGVQPGLHYLRTRWDVDGLMQQFLSDDASESWQLREEDVRLEVRGARGAFQMTRLSAATFAFRQSLLAGVPLGTSATAAVELDPIFDPGGALLALIDEHLVIAFASNGASS